MEKVKNEIAISVLKAENEDLKLTIRILINYIKDLKKMNEGILNKYHSFEKN